MTVGYPGLKLTVINTVICGNIRENVYFFATQSDLELD